MFSEEIASFVCKPSFGWWFRQANEKGSQVRFSNFRKCRSLVLLTFSFFLFLSLLALGQVDHSDLQKRRALQTIRIDKRFGNPLVDYSLHERRIVLVDQTDRTTGKREGWLILCQSPKDRDHLEVKLMSAQKFVGGKKNGISIFFDDGKRLLMAGIWRNDAPWEGDFFLEPPRGTNLILDGILKRLVTLEPSNEQLVLNKALTKGWQAIICASILIRLWKSCAMQFEVPQSW